MATLLVMRSLVAARDPFSDAKDTLSSWDKCMAKAYCKWPVIAAIIIGSIIVISTVLCIARCICCGAEMACCCFKCCTCCCPSGGRSGRKRAQTPPPHPYNPSAYPPAPPHAPIDDRPANQQYRSHATPTFNPAPAPSYASSLPPPPPPEAPAFARFDAHAKPANEDALPAMPSWKDAKSVQVEETYFPEKQGDVEMDRLTRHESVTESSVAAMAALGTARMSPGPRRSPVQHLQTEHGHVYSQLNQNGSYVNDSPRRSPHTSPGPYGGPYGYQQDSFRTQQSLSPVHASAANYAQGQQFDRHSPASAYSQSQYDPYDQQQHVRTPSPLNTNNYGHSNAGLYQNPMAVSPVYEAPALPTALAPGQSPMTNPSPGYSPSGATIYDPPIPSSSPAPAYPGQQTYGASDGVSPQPYQAYAPTQPQSHGQQYSGVPRKAVGGSWKEV